MPDEPRVDGKSESDEQLLCRPIHLQSESILTGIRIQEIKNVFIRKKVYLVRKRKPKSRQS